MPTDHRTRLANIKYFDQLIVYLRDEMGWPITRDSFDDADDLFYDFTPEELGIDAKNAAKIQEIKRLRPLSIHQPWGIFFVKFEPKKLPVVALRRILNQVALKKRASANSAERVAWSADDLLFVSNYGEGETRQISFVHFSENETNKYLPTVKVLGWDNLDTGLHLDHVADQLTERLAWPDDESNVDRWRAVWRSAFTLRHREVITTSREMALRLAELAQAIRDRINTVLPIETENGPVTKLMEAFKEALVHDLDKDGFADMYAQTIAYGLLSARVANPSGGTADDLAAAMPVTNPFLKELMETFLRVGDREGKVSTTTGMNFDELGVTEVVELLDAAKMEDVVRDFGDRNPQEDPVIHFYELFLKEYDAKKRMQRGVFYTPRPVVSFIVRSVDKLLRSEFGLEDGLADTTTWGEMVGRFDDLQIPEGATPDQAFVQILDPVTGTGTFLVEVIGLVHRTMTEKWKAEGYAKTKIEELWNDYVPKHLLPRLHGYELMMAPYAIAHMKIGLKLYETGYRFGSEERVRVYLTNALEPAQDFSGTLAFAIPALAHEAKAVNAVKRDQRFTVVIGNPPYSVLSANLTHEARSIIDLYRSCNGRRIEERSMLRLEMHLQDDYVKFMGLTQKLLRQTRNGVLGLVTNNGYLDNLTLRGVRFALLEQFGVLLITNLHGSRLRQASVGATSRTDENVFAIEQGVAVLCGATTYHSKRVTSRWYTDLRGLRAEKYKALMVRPSEEERGTVLSPTGPQFFLVPRDESAWPEYERFVPLPEAMPVNISGIITAHDSLVVDFDDNRLIQNARMLRDTSLGTEEVRANLRVKDNAGWKLAKALDEFRKSDNDAAFLRDYGYRPFDTRRIYYHSAIVWSDRKNAMSHILGGTNVALATCRQLAEGPWRHVFVTRYLQDDCFISNRTRERSYHFPVELRGSGKQRGLQTEPLGLETEIRPNFSKRFLETLSPILRLSGTDGVQDTDMSNAIFRYIYAVLHSGTYRSRYSEFLKVDFPRIPFPSGCDLFRDLAHLGGELVALHLMDSPKLDRPITTYTGPKNLEVGRVGWSDGTVWLDAAKTSAREWHRATAPGTIGFRGVPEEVWQFYIGGYQVCYKWLKDRKGRTLSDEDRDHYQRIVVALGETIRIMAEIDEVIETHGGCPDAFRTGE